jgi:ATP-dependent DNA helicase 2 subunit 2
MRKDEHVRARDEDDEMLILDQFPKKSASQRQNSQLQSQRHVQTADEEEDLLHANRSANGTHGAVTPMDEDAPEVDAGRAPGRIVGSTFPLVDFRKNIAQGDLVTKAVADLAFVIQDVVLKPFASRRHAEMMECLLELRDVALKVSEVGSGI